MAAVEIEPEDDLIEAEQGAVESAFVEAERIAEALIFASAQPVSERSSPSACRLGSMLVLCWRGSRRPMRRAA